VPTYNRYSTDLKIAAAAGTLPRHLANAIPASTLASLKHFDPTSLFAAEHAFPVTKELLVEFAAAKTAVTLFRAALKAKSLLVTALSRGRSIVNALGRTKESVTRVFSQVARPLGRRRVLRLLGITSNRMTRWMRQRRCPVSLRSLCLRTHPQQLASTEIATIKAAVGDSQFRGWPLASIYWKKMREGVFSFTLATFYKYANLLGLRAASGNGRRKNHSPGLRASRPDEIWHADVTVFRTLDNVKCFIYLVVDNFSRRILAWEVATCLSGALHLQSVREAVERFLPNTDESTEDLTRLITDGGPENITDPSLPVVRQVAGVDIRFSNSLVESVNKVVKYQSLYLHDITNVTKLREHLKEWIPTYNNERPHSSLAPLTPKEVHEGQIPDTSVFREQITDGRRERIEANKREACPVCGPVMAEAVKEEGAQ
jgi:putative transposase